MQINLRSIVSLPRLFFPLVLLLALPTFLAIDSADAAVPAEMAYQGYLRGSSGTPFNGTVNLSFRLYPSLAGGTQLWEETQNAVPVVAGVFSVILGKTISLNLPFDQVYFLGTSVNGGAEMVPRHQLTAAPYALRAKSVDNDNDTLGALTCSSGEVAKRIGNTWQCAPDDTTIPQPNALGTYIGSFRVRCPNEDLVNSFSLTINTQSNAAVSGTAFLSASSGGGTVTQSVNWTGRLTRGGVFHGEFSSNLFFNGVLNNVGFGNLTGSLAGNRLDVQSVTQDNSGIVCVGTGSAVR